MTARENSLKSVHCVSRYKKKIVAPRRHGGTKQTNYGVPSDYLLHTENCSVRDQIPVLSNGIQQHFNAFSSSENRQDGTEGADRGGRQEGVYSGRDKRSRQHDRHG